MNSIITTIIITLLPIICGLIITLFVWLSDVSATTTKLVNTVKTDETFAHTLESRLNQLETKVTELDEQLNPVEEETEETEELSENLPE